MKSMEMIVGANRIVVAAMLLIIPASLTAQASAQKTAQNSPEAAEARTLLKLEDDWCKGLMNRDSAMFRKMLAPGFVYTENASVMSRDSVIKGVMTGDKVERAWNQYMQVHEFGPVAAVTGVLSVTSRGKKGVYTTRYRFTDTWLNTRGTWQLVAAQDYILPDRPGR